jgi:hypothetical protein
MINIIEKLFDEDCCDYVYDYAKNNFVKELRGDSVTWRIQKNTNIDFENEIKSKMSHLINDSRMSMGDLEYIKIINKLTDPMVRFRLSEEEICTLQQISDKL